jgi:hypothetical protein
MLLRRFHHGGAEVAFKDKDKERAWRREYMRKRYAADPKMREDQRLYRSTRKPKYAEYQRNSRARSPKDHLVSQAKMRAKRDGLPFNLTVDGLYWPTHCPILGIKLNYSKEPTAEREGWQLRSNTVTLDRRINELGYVAGNVFAISHRANRIKSDATFDELKAVLAYMERPPNGHQP